MAAANLSVLEGKKMELPALRLVHKYFEDAVKNDVEKAKSNGVHYKYKFTSYYDINEKANNMARNIQRMIPETAEGETRRCRVIGVDIEPSADVLVTLLAILKCGAGYLPLDFLLPANRIKHIVTDAKPELIVVESKSTHLLCNNVDVYPNGKVVDVLDLLETNSVTSSDDVMTKEPINEDEAVVGTIYTSGSTGVPKGVLVRHVSLMNRLLWQWETYPWQQGEVACCKAALQFLDSMVELFSTTLKLVPMVLAERGLVTHVDKFLDLLEDFKVTRLIFVPSLLRNFISFSSLSQKPRLPDLNLFVSNSEALPPRLLKNFFETFPGKQFANFYGSTETMADVTYETYSNPRDLDEKSSDGKLSIGTPMLNSNLYILNEGLELLPHGEVGEICISGLNVARGYSESLKSVASVRFVNNPYSQDREHAVLYKTGDYGKIVDGRVIYYGRRDMQAKIRGHTINTSEIDRVVGDIPGVQAVAILCHELSESSVVVVAYYTVKPGNDVTEETVIDACERFLPCYMIPKPLKISEIPLQRQSGKIDRQALKRIFDEMRLHEGKLSRDIESLDDTSVAILKVIARALYLPETSINLSKDFTDYGGNSVNALETILLLREHGFHITLDEFAKARSIREMIAKCEPVECASPQMSVE